MTYQIIQGELPGALSQAQGLYHALISDPPYELGFMNRSWDRSGVSFRAETWSACLEKLYPGAFGLVFGGSRTYHRIAVALEDAGALIHPSIFGWFYASGFPKATRVIVPEAERWEGHRYGLQAMRPAVEPIILFQKPYKGRPRDSMAETGAGALNISGAAHQRESRYVPGMGHFDRAYGRNTPEQAALREGKVSDTSWPANGVVLHRPECAESCSPDCAVLALRASGAPMESFLALGWELETQERLGRADVGVYCPKPQSEEKDAGIDSPLVTVDDGRQKPIDNPYLRGETERRNTHPTVKPLALAQWLATLLLPPAGYQRRLLVPFSGSGSEMIGGLLSGWDEVVGIELREQAVKESRERLEWWISRKRETLAQKPKEILKSKAQKGLTLLDLLDNNKSGG